MSDIPLRSIRRQKPPEQAGFSRSYTGNMTTSRRNQDGKRNGKYMGDPEEEAGLLYDAEDEYNELRGAMSPVCQLFYIFTFLVYGSAVEKSAGTSEEFRTPCEGW